MSILTADSAKAYVENYFKGYEVKITGVHEKNDGWVHSFVIDFELEGREEEYEVWVEKDKNGAEFLYGEW